MSSTGPRVAPTAKAIIPPPERLRAHKACRRTGRGGFSKSLPGFPHKLVYSLRRDNFVTKVLGWARQNKELFIVDDQIGSPTGRECWRNQRPTSGWRRRPSKDWIAERRGVYHLAGDGTATRLEWATETLRLDPHPEEQLCSHARAAQTSDFPSHAVRPLYSALDCSRFISVFGLRLPPWRTALQMEWI